MKIEEMSKHFREKNCGVGTFSTKIISTSQNIIFRQMTLNDIIILAKTAMETPGSQTIVLNGLLQRLAIQGIAFDTITELDRIYLFAEIKKANMLGKEEPTIKFKCSRCNKEFVFKLDIDNYTEKLIAAHKPNKMFNAGDKTILTIGLPSSSIWEIWMQYTDTIRNQNKNENVADIIIAKYSFIPYIKHLHKLNGITLDTPFETLTFDKKIELINNIPITEFNLFEAFMLEEKFTETRYGIIYDVKCASCAAVNNILVGPSSFFQ